MIWSDEKTNHTWCDAVNRKMGKVLLRVTNLLLVGRPLFDVAMGARLVGSAFSPTPDP
jgi:hypothetical protein